MYIPRNISIERRKQHWPGMPGSRQLAQCMFGGCAPVRRHWPAVRCALYLKALLAFNICLGCVLLVAHRRGINLERPLRNTAIRLRLIAGTEVTLHNIPYPTTNVTCNRLPYTIAIVVFVKPGSAESTQYPIAQHTLRCYALRWGYELIEVAQGDHSLYNVSRCWHKDLLLHKHCAVAETMRRRPDVRWWMVLDADTGVVYPDRCVEEYIDESVSLVMYRRFFSWEIAAGNYLAKNTEFARQFLLDWADYDSQIDLDKTQSHDQGAIHIHLLKTLQPHNYWVDKCERQWYVATGWETYFVFTSCCLAALGSTDYWPGKVRLLARGQAWVLDRHIVDDLWCPRLFMMHGWKTQQIVPDAFPLIVGVGSRTRDQTEPYYSKISRLPTLDECSSPDVVWPYRPDNLVSCETIRQILADRETERQRAWRGQQQAYLPYLIAPDIGDCWPDC